MAGYADMSGRFTGWPEAAYDVLLRLDGDPSMAERERLRPERERLVRKPMVALLQDLADAEPAFDDFWVASFRLTVSWWQHQYATIRIAHNVVYGLRFDLDGLRVSGGWWSSDRDQLERFRTVVADEERGAELAGLLDDLRAVGARVSGNTMTRVPRGFPADHPHAELLRHRSLLGKLPLGCDDWLHTPAVVERVLAACTTLQPLVSWFAENVDGDHR